MRNPPLRIGLLVDGNTVTSWMAAAISAATAQGLGEVELVIEREAPSPLERPGRIRGWWRNRNYLAFALMSRVDSGRKDLPPLPYQVPLDTVATAERIRVKPITTTFTDAFPERDLERIRAAELDVILRDGFRILVGGILRAARHGVLSFHHGDNRTNRGGPPGVWEVLEDLPTTGVVLQELTEELDGGRTLARSIGATKRFSFHRNQAHLFARSATMLVRSLKRLHEGHSAVQPTVATEPQWNGYARRIFRTPTNVDILRHLPGLVRRYTRERLHSLTATAKWQIAYHWTRAASGDTPSGAFRRFTHLEPPQDRYWADPFVAEDNGRYWLFLEELPSSTQKGVISTVEMSRAGPSGTPRVVLEEAWHLSYPFVFKHDGRWLLLPEASESGRVQIYEAVEFPFTWRPLAVLLDGVSVVDGTLHHHEGTWYLFCSLQCDGIALDEELHLYWADDLQGPYRPHPLNPILTDVTRARMAGRLFRVGDELYRPAQNCAPTYGAGLVVHRVNELTRTTYSETPTHHLLPEWNPAARGMHTLNAAGGLTVIDLLRRRPRRGH